MFRQLSSPSVRYSISQDPQGGGTSALPQLRIGDDQGTAKHEQAPGHDVEPELAEEDIRFAADRDRRMNAFKERNHARTPIDDDKVLARAENAGKFSVAFASGTPVHQQ